MSGDQTYKGSFVFADAHCLEAGIDHFLEVNPASREHSVLDLFDLEIRKLKVSVDWDGSAPASMAFGTESALRRLATYAKSGRIRTTYTDEGTEHGSVTAHGRTSADGLPPRHHRWEVYAAARSGDVKALRALAKRGIALDLPIPQLGGYTAMHVAANAPPPRPSRRSRTAATAAPAPVPAPGAAAVAALLELGLAADAVASGGTSPLFLARTVEVAELLLAAGADVNRRDGDRSPLSSAIESERFDVAQRLVDAGATLAPGAAVHACARLAREHELRLLISAFERDPGLASALVDPDVMRSAVSAGASVVIGFLLEQGAVLPNND